MHSGGKRRCRFFPNRSCHRFNCFQMRRQRYELILDHPNFQRRKMISRTDPVISATADAHASGGSLFVKLMALDGLVVNGYCLVLAISWKRRLGFFLDSVSHIAFVDFGANLYNFLENHNYYLEYYDFLRNVHIHLFQNLYFYIHNYIILHKHSDNQ